MNLFRYILIFLVIFIFSGVMGCEYIDTGNNDQEKVQSPPKKVESPQPESKQREKPEPCG